MRQAGQGRIVTHSWRGPAHIPQIGQPYAASRTRSAWAEPAAEQVYPYLFAVGVTVGAGDDLEFSVVGPDAYPIAAAQAGVTADRGGLGLGVAFGPRLGFEGFERDRDGAVAARPRPAGGDPFGDDRSRVVERAGQEGRGFDALLGVDVAIGVGLADPGAPC